MLFQGVRRYRKRVRHGIHPMAFFFSPYHLVLPILPVSAPHCPHSPSIVHSHLFPLGCIIHLASSAFQTMLVPAWKWHLTSSSNGPSGSFCLTQSFLPEINTSISGVLCCSLLASLSYHHETPEFRWLKTTEMYYFLLLETGILKSWCWRVCVPFEGSRGEFVSWPPLSFQMAGYPWLVGALLQSPPLSAHSTPLVSLHIISLCVCLSQCFFILYGCYGYGIRIHPRNCILT